MGVVVHDFLTWLVHVATEHFAFIFDYVTNFVTKYKACDQRQNSRKDRLYQ